jgi:hypothetical protein
MEESIPAQFLALRTALELEQLELILSIDTAAMLA